MELISLKDMPREVIIGVLRELGYDSDGIFVTDKSGQKVMDPYIDEPVKLDNLLILPGSEVILDSNPISVAGYFEDHGDVL
jgi:hypothetical protein